MSCGSTADWNALLAVQAGAAATLMGLVFVAVSINLGQIMSFPGLPGRAAESILQFLEIFVVSTVALVPGQTQQILAIEILAAGMAFWMVQTVGQIRYLGLRKGHPWSWFAYRAALGQLAAIPFCVGGLMLLQGFCSGFYWLVPGFVLSFAAGVLSAWVLLVEIHR